MRAVPDRATTRENQHAALDSVSQQHSYSEFEILRIRVLSDSLAMCSTGSASGRPGTYCGVFDASVKFTVSVAAPRSALDSFSQWFRDKLEAAEPGTTAEKCATGSDPDRP